MKQVRLCFAGFVICCMTTSSCSQTNSPGNLPAHDFFVGSTPCDSLIKSILKIPTASKCDFIKWELTLYINGSDSFLLTALHGESKPNTNGFMGGGEKITASGKYTTGQGVNEYPKLKFYRLEGEKFLSPVFLVEMDNNIFHFADSNKKLLVGNGGWGYSLNRVQ